MDLDTLPVISFIGGLLFSGLCNLMLVIVPKDGIDEREDEWKKLLPDQALISHFYGTKGKRENELEKLTTGAGICLTSYDIISSNVELLNNCMSYYLIVILSLFYLELY